MTKLWTYFGKYFILSANLHCSKWLKIENNIAICSHCLWLRRSEFTSRLLNVNVCKIVKKRKTRLLSAKILFLLVILINHSIIDLLFASATVCIFYFSARDILKNWKRFKPSFFKINIFFVFYYFKGNFSIKVHL